MAVGGPRRGLVCGLNDRTYPPRREADPGAGNGMTGTFMNATLKKEDAAALDLLLDRGRAAAQDGPRFTAAAVSQGRLQSAEKVLGLLQLLPDVEPPQDLVSRTLRRVDQTMWRGPEVTTEDQLPLGAGSPQPHA